MPHPLDGARLKVIRAQEHLRAFDQEVAGYLNTKPYLFDSEIHGDHWWLKPRVIAAPPERIGLIVGDVVTNARAALDYVIWEAAQRYFPIKPDLDRQADRSILNFPILLDANGRRQGHIDHLDRLQRRSLPASALNIIKAVQRDVSGNDSLQRLSDLVNTDKHRSLVLTVGVTDRMQVHFTPWAGQAWLIRSDDYEFLKNGAALKAPPDLLAGIATGQVDVNLQMSVTVTSANPPMPDSPLSTVLTNIVECVADVVGCFDVVF